eukprot:TRINITY_DN4129_c0_g2_i2.p1 TRINITY_DN4129_c0_g2~~TRINITY_DN4129_c0_g2_i2.p1  ORF type:complete len:667 (+),score=114.94 TRINITY_DN4129_c0_g2_i2:120-2120(+)
MAGPAPPSPVLQSTASPPLLATDDDWSGIPDLVGLNVEAPAFFPKQGQKHCISLFNASNFRTETLECDLQTLTVAELRQQAQKRFPQLGSAEPGFELLVQGIELTRKPNARPVDAGLANNGVIVVRPIGMVQQLPDASATPTAGVVQAVPQQYVQLAQSADCGQLSIPVLTQLSSVPALPLFSSCQPIQPTPLSVPVTAAAQQPHVWTEPSATADQSAVSSLQALESDFVFNATSGEGSRAIVQALNSLPDSHSPVLARVVSTAVEHMRQLAAQQHASRVLCALASVATHAQVTQLLAAACPFIGELGVHNAGSDTLLALTSAVNHSTPAARSQKTGVPLVIEAMCGAAAALCTAVSGRKLCLHVVGLQLPAADLRPFYEAVSASIMNISTDQCGCITIQRLCDAACYGLTQILHRQLIEVTPHIITDPYGNYALQHAVKEDVVCSQAVAKAIAGKVVELAANKFASNVIERCLQTGPEQVRTLLIPELTTPAALDSLMQDAYGNYVVQSCVEHAPLPLLDAIKDQVLARVSRSPYGYRIETKLQRRSRRSGRGGGRRERAHHNSQGAGGQQTQGRGVAPPPQPQTQTLQPAPSGLPIIQSTQLQALPTAVPHVVQATAPQPTLVPQVMLPAAAAAALPVGGQLFYVAQPVLMPGAARLTESPQAP